MYQTILMKKSQVAKQMLQMQEDLACDEGHVLHERQMITDMPSMELIDKLKEGELTALKVLKAFQTKALEITKRINCVTEFIPEAQAWAEACDLIPSEKRGPLHGLPVSIKDSINVCGMDCTLGLAKNCYNPASSHAVIVTILMKNGAVPFCKTNVPQTLISYSCSNPVYGITVNPWDSTRTSGGSSGGEAALIAAGGSVVGIGTDLGGSIRIPANFSGCVGLKPTMNRISSKGVKKGLRGAVGLAGTVGIMGRDVDIVNTCMKVLTDDSLMGALDAKVPSLLWNELEFPLSEKLKFGYFDTLEFSPSTPSVRRAVMMAKDALESAGFKVEQFEIPDMFEMYKTIMKFVGADAGRTLKHNIKDEVIDPLLASHAKLWSIPKSFRGILKSYVAMTSPLLAEELQNECFDSYYLWKNMIKKEDFIEEIIQMMKERDISLLLSPVYGMPAPQYYVTSATSAASIYSLVFNLLDFPSGTVPVTIESEEDQEKLEDYPELNTYCRIVKKATRGAFGLPVGVLITGLPWQEELVARGMLELEMALKILSKK